MSNEFSNNNIKNNNKCMMNIVNQWVSNLKPVDLTFQRNKIRDNSKRTHKDIFLTRSFDFDFNVIYLIKLIKYAYHHWGGIEAGYYSG